MLAHIWYMCVCVYALLHLREFGRTETIGNTSDPEFTKQFVMDFCFNEIQYIKASQSQ